MTQTYYKIRITKTDGVSDIRKRFEEIPDFDFLSVIKETIEKEKINPVTIKNIEVIKKEVKETVVGFGDRLVDQMKHHFKMKEVLEEGELN